MKIDFFNTYIHQSASNEVLKVLQSTYLSEGTVVKEFEAKLENELGLQNVVTLNSGTSALHLALELAGVKTGDEVILPAQTFIASGLAILYLKAIPVFADINYNDGNINVNDIEKKITSKTKAIMPVHWGGYPCDMDEINALATKYNLKVIEDAAHALGAVYKNKTIGNISDFTCFSFQAIKHLTTGDGGAITTKNKNNYKLAITKRWFGIDRSNAIASELGERKYDVSEVGYKYHLNNYSAALGIANASDYKQRLNARCNLANFYKKELSNVSGIKLWNFNPDRESAFWLFGFHVEKRLDFIKALKEKGIPVSVVHQSICDNTVFGSNNFNLEEQKKFDETQIHIPIHDAITMENAEYIVSKIKVGW